MQNTTRNFKKQTDQNKTEMQLVGHGHDRTISTAGQRFPQHAEKYFKYFYGISIFYVFNTRFNVPYSGARISL
jgi:hypothetical protein